MGIDHNKRLKEHLYYYSARISRDISNLIKWLVLAVITGCIVGAASTLFSFTLKAVTSYRKAHEWIFFLLPLSGLVIVFLYEKLGKEDGGTNQVLSTVRSRDDVPILSAPLIFITTALTHLTGGSAGREGAAIQLGGSIANQLGRWIHLDEEDRHVIVMCGMSAAFSALFGTPIGSGSFCAGSGQCGRDVLCSTDAVHDRVIDRFRICSRNGSHTGKFSCDGYSGTDCGNWPENGSDRSGLCNCQHYVLYCAEWCSRTLWQMV